MTKSTARSQSNKEDEIGQQDEHVIIIDNQEELETNLHKFMSGMLKVGSFHFNNSNNKSSKLFKPDN